MKLIIHIIYYLCKIIKQRQHFNTIILLNDFYLEWGLKEANISNLTFVNKTK